MADPADIADAKGFLSRSDFPVVDKQRHGHNVTFRWEKGERSGVVTIAFHDDHWVFEEMRNEPRRAGVLTLIANVVAETAIEHDIKELRAHITPQTTEAFEAVGFKPDPSHGMVAAPKDMLAKTEAALKKGLPDPPPEEPPPPGETLKPGETRPT